ncbi:uncharacterized protein MKK02DRAFT_38226 [Dioszegia hungarica]|uniref:Transmembrane protein n=1 Tax=Dioszegia hungarica TaxID=4972 RepID=A0AA38LRY1_9TREE|nr:uncharacterized protein MKK02DRAFT_38226 [Dioszegia hungarica]KAI9633570.1 hypothetical protein MKK02DRAFT_38226 [Dioszegia hungarica]
MSNSGVIAQLDLPVRCFSQLVNVRCQGLSSSQHIVASIPFALLIVILPFLLISTWKIPRASLLLLGIEIILHLGVHAWDLGYFLLRPSFSNFRSTDTALAIASATPILVYLLALTSHLLSDIRGYLPFSLQGKGSSIVYAVLIAPLIPLAYAASLLGGFAFVQHRQVRGAIFLSFANIQEDWVNAVLTNIGTIAALAYILFVVLLALIPLLHPPSTYAYLSSFPTLRPLLICTLSILLSGAETALGFVPLDALAPTVTFIVILLRGCLLLLSRAGVIGSLIWAYSIKEERRKRRSGLFVGGPIQGTFRKLDAGGTTDFYVVHAEQHGLGSGRAAIPTAPDKVVLRTPRAHAPKLSFTSSAFAAFSPPTPLREQPSRTDMHGRSRAIGENRPDRKTRKNLGSIYAPKRVTVDPLTLAQWPPTPVPPDTRPESGTLPSIAGDNPGAERLWIGGARDGEARRVESSQGTADPFDASNSDDAVVGSTNTRLASFASSFSPGPSPTSSRGEMGLARLGQTPSRQTPIATAITPPSPGASIIAIPSAPVRTNSYRRKPVPQVAEVSSAQGSYSPSSTSRPVPGRNDLTQRKSTAPSPVSSYTPSVSDHRRTLFYATPMSSPTTSPTKEEYLFPLPSSRADGRGPPSRQQSWRQAPESATLPQYSADRGVSLSGYQRDSEVGVRAMASLARLRRETGMALDVERLGKRSPGGGRESVMTGLSVLSASSSPGQLGKERYSGISGISGVSDVGEVATPTARAGDLEEEEKGAGAWWAYPGDRRV